MPVSKALQQQLENASWIRRMFEEGVRLKRERGADAVFDFSLGNPDVEPPPAVLDALRRVVAGNRPGSHGYMPNPGYPAGARNRSPTSCTVKPAWPSAPKTSS